MTLSLDLSDNLARFPIAYSYQPVKGWAVKHFEIGATQSIQRTKQQALGEGPWDGVVKLFADAFEIGSGDYSFHNGDGADAADAFFPDEEPHPWTASINARCPAGISATQADSLFGIYRTLRTPNFDGSGVQLDSLGAPIGGGDPRNYYFFKPNPANVAVDQLLRWGQRIHDIVNFPAFVDWRDFNDEVIPWDDAKYTPRSLSLTGTGGGSLTPGQTYYVRVSTFKGADESSASQKTIEIDASDITLAGGQTAFQVNWLIRGDELTPPAPPGDIASYRVYIGTTPGVWLGYFPVATPTLRSLIVTTTAGVTAGSPLDTCTAGLLRNIPRFECGLFFVPPYTLSSALDRICQVSCTDWQWSGFGTSTYRNDKIRFLSPANRTPVFTLDQSQVAPGSFKTWAVDRRQRYNQIIGTFRDRDDDLLSIGTPVVMDREQMQDDDNQIKSFTIDFGTCFRSQVQRGVSYWARMLCDLDQMASLKGSPKTYHVLPADVVEVTLDTPDWSAVQFMVNKKQETIETAIGDPLTMQIYSPDAYSDTAHSPLPLPLRVPRFDPFSAPPVATGLVLTEIVGYAPDMSAMIGISGSFDFSNFGGPQLARVFMKGPALGPSYAEPSDSTYSQIEMIAMGSDVESGFERRGLSIGKYWIKVVTESVGFGVSAGSGHPVTSIILSQPPATPLSLAGIRISTDLVVTWLPGVDGAFLPETYILRVRDAGSGALKRTTTIQIPDWIPCKWGLYLNVAGDPSLISQDPDGSIYSTVQPTGVLVYTSQPFFGDCDIQWEVDDRPFALLGVVSSPPGTPVGVFIESAEWFGQPQFIDAEVATGLIRRLAPATHLEIRIRNGQAEYWLDGKFWMRGFQGPVPATFLVAVDMSAAVTGAQAALRVRVRPFAQRQFVYTTAMAVTDFGSDPGTERIDITQLSQAGIESPVASIVA